MATGTVGADAASDWKAGIPGTWNGAEVTGLGRTGVPVRERLWLVREEPWFLRGKVGCLIGGISRECSSLKGFLGFLYLGSQGQ